jgi:histidyl-tRNA synthetase
VLRILDKTEKQSEQSILQGLSNAGVPSRFVEPLYTNITSKWSASETLLALARLGFQNEMALVGMEELRAVVLAIQQFGVPESAFGIDLSVVRGLDYYTGTIYETTLVGAPELGSICSGGRYDDLASYFTDTKLPGVGISIGLTRLFSRLKEAGLLQPLPRTPAEVLVTTMDQQHLDKYFKMATALRAAGINTEVYLETAKLGNQLTYADRKGFRLALIAGETEFAGGQVQIKDLSSKQQHMIATDRIVPAVKDLLKMKD